ncbi:hypothetical protein HaLaN_32907, partial [Haematococcus lacustris]
FGSLADDDDEALPPKPATDDDSELTVSEELTHEEPVTAKGVKGARGEDGSDSKARVGVKAKGRLPSMSVSSMEDEEAGTLDAQAAAVHSQGPNRPKRAAASASQAKGTLNTAAEAVKGRAPRAKTGKEAWDEANKPPLKPATVWRLPDFDPINPDVHDVDSEEQRIAFARKVEDKGFAMMRLPERLHPSRFPKLLWAL